jgi:hypothetical protein
LILCRRNSIIKLSPKRNFQTFDDVISSINYLMGYVKLTQNQVPLSSTDFGHVQLRKSARSHDVESLLKLLNTVDRNFTKHQLRLMAKGFQPPPKPAGGRMGRTALWSLIARHAEEHLLFG